MRGPGDKIGRLQLRQKTWAQGTDRHHGTAIGIPGGSLSAYPGISDRHVEYATACSWPEPQSGSCRHSAQAREEFSQAHEYPWR